MPVLAVFVNSVIAREVIPHGVPQGNFLAARVAGVAGSAKNFHDFFLFDVRW
jgi:hypothetical protein